MGRIRVELFDYIHGTLRQVLDWGITYCHRHMEEPSAVWLSPENYNIFRRDFDQRFMGPDPSSGSNYRGIPIQMDSRTGMYCAMEVDLRGKLPWPPNFQDPVMPPPPPKATGTIYDAIMDEALV